MTLDTAAMVMDQALDILEQCGETVPTEMRARLQELSDKTFDGDTVYPSVGVSEEKEVGLHWIAAERSMELSLSPNGEWFFHSTNDGDNFTMEGCGALPYEALRLQFADFSYFVNQRNPQWRVTLSR